MFRSVLTLFGAALLALGLVFAVSDIARSLAVDAVTLTRVDEALASVGLSAVPIEDGSRAAVDVAALVSGWPASVTLGVAALLFLFLGRPPAQANRRMAR